MAESAEAASLERTSNGVILTGLAFGHSMFHWLSQSVVVVLPEIQGALGLNALGVGAVLTVREVASGIVTIPGGIVSDMLRRHWGLLLAACVGLLGAGSLLMGLSPVYFLLLLGVAILAAVHSIWHLPASATLSQYFPHRRGMALSVHGVGGGVGDVVGPIGTGALLLVLSWRGVLSVYAVLPILMAFVVFWSLRGVGRTGESGSSQTNRHSQFDLSKGLLKSPALWGITVIRGLRGMALVALLTVLPLYFDSELGQSTFVRGFHLALLIVVGLAAKPLAGYLSDRIGRKQVLVPGLIWSSALALLLIPFGQGIGLTVTVALLGLFLYPDQPILTAAMLDLVPADVINTALGLSRFVSFSLSALSPLIAGALYQSSGIDASLYYVAALFACAAVFFALLRIVPLRD